MKASIIIPAWNAERHIAECLDSIQRQTFDNFECIIVDDGSVDRTLDVCRGYAVSDSRFCILTQNHKGLSAARNLGLDAASGDWIYLADADDRLSLVCLEHSLNFADMNSLQAVFWNAGVIDEGADSTKANIERNWLARASADCGFCSGEEAFCSMLETRGVFRSAVWFYAIRRDCLKARFVDSLIYAEDELYAIQNLLPQERTGCLNEILYWKRIHPESQMHSRMEFWKLNAIAESVLSVVDWMDDFQSRLQARTIGWIDWWIDRKITAIASIWNRLDKWEQDKIRTAEFRERLLIRKAVEMNTAFKQSRTSNLFRMM